MQKMDKLELVEILASVGTREINIIEANKKITSKMVSIELLKKAYNLIPDGTEHIDLIEIKKAIFGNEKDTNQQFGKKRSFGHKPKIHIRRN